MKKNHVWVIEFITKTDCFPSLQFDQHYNYRDEARNKLKKIKQDGNKSYRIRKYVSQ